MAAAAVAPVAPVASSVTANHADRGIQPTINQPTGIDLVCFRWAGLDLAMPAACVIGLGADDAGPTAAIPDPGTWLGRSLASTPGARQRRLQVAGTLPAALAPVAETADERGAGQYRPATPSGRDTPASRAGIPGPDSAASRAAMASWSLRVEEPVTSLYLPASAIHPLPPLIAARLTLPHLRALALTPPPVRLLLILVPEPP